MGHGGARPGGGRPKGSVGKATAEALAKAKAEGILPLDYLLKIMRDGDADEAKRIDCAKAAAPYIHQKLTATELTGKDGGPVKTVVNVGFIAK
jgi:hypothetical protein